nr:SDR family oxidoreductase [uncultured Desulfobulbus sp.]
MKTICITGAFGFIGRHVARLYATKGWQVTGIGHGSWGRDEWRQWGITNWHLTDISLDSMLTYAGRPDIILHCAGSGSVTFSMDHPFQDFQRSVATTAAVLEFIRMQSPETRLIYPSSAGVYGLVAKQPIEVSTPLHPISPYGVHKKMCEELCKSYAKHFKIPVAIVRLFSVYGNTLRKQLLWDACIKLSDNETCFFGGGQEQRDWLHIDDAASLLYAAGNCASQQCPTVNGGTGIGTSTKEILSEIFASFGRADLPQFTGAPRPGDPVDYIADLTETRKWDWRPSKEWRQKVREYVEWYKTELS